MQRSIEHFADSGSGFRSLGRKHQLRGIVEQGSDRCLKRGGRAQRYPWLGVQVPGDLRNLDVGAPLGALASGSPLARRRVRKSSSQARRSHCGSRSSSPLLWAARRTVSSTCTKGRPDRTFSITPLRCFATTTGSSTRRRSTPMPKASKRFSTLPAVVRDVSVDWATPLCSITMSSGMHWRAARLAVS